MYRCKDCGFECESHNKYVAHRAHFDHNIICKICNKPIGAIKRLFIHYFDDHKNEGVLKVLELLNLSEIPKCPECGKDCKFDIYRFNYCKFCSRKCQARYKNKLNLANGTHPWDYNENSTEEHKNKVIANRIKQITELTNSHSSKIELDFYNKVKTLYPSAENNYFIKSNVEGKNYYYLDIYIPEFKIDIEIDGPFHHNQVESDSLRDKDLLSRGIKVHRIIANSARKYNIQMISDLIKSLIGNQ